jgi:hypothetical protein
VPWEFEFDSAVDATWSSPENRRSHDVIIDGLVVDGRLHFTITFCPENDAKVAELVKKKMLEYFLLVFILRWRCSHSGIR